MRGIELLGVEGHSKLNVAFFSNETSGYSLPDVSSGGIIASFRLVFDHSYFTELAIPISGLNDETTIVYARGGISGGNWVKLS